MPGNAGDSESYISHVQWMQKSAPAEISTSLVLMYLNGGLGDVILFQLILCCFILCVTVLLLNSDL